MKTLFTNFIEKHQLFKVDDRILLAVSGGVDSMVLCDLMSACNYHFAIAHCNFQLREEAEEEVEWIKAQAKKYDVDYYYKTFDTKAYQRQHKVSIQMAARELRYQWFKEVMVQKAYTYLATAHHKNDVLETVIYNLAKGTGLPGFHGIPIKSSQVVRPLMFATKEEIITYAHQRKLTWREDSSNSSIKYNRNLIRHKVVPILKQINPKLDSNILKTTLNVRAHENLLEELVRTFLKDLIAFSNHEVRINMDKVLEWESAAALLFQWIKAYGFTYEQSCVIVSSAHQQSGKQYYSPTHVLVKDRLNWVITKKQEEKEELILIQQDQEQVSFDLGSLHIYHESIKEVSLSSDKNTAFLDREQLQFPLVLRKWQHGDYFYPLGMNKRKKLSDFIIDTKIPLNLKQNIWVLTSNGSIVWVLGKRISERYKITSDTNKVLKIYLRSS